MTASSIVAIYFGMAGIAFHTASPIAGLSCQVSYMSWSRLMYRCAIVLLTAINSLFLLYPTGGIRLYLDTSPCPEMLHPLLSPSALRHSVDFYQSVVWWNRLTDRTILLT